MSDLVTGVGGNDLGAPVTGPRATKRNDAQIPQEAEPHDHAERLAERPRMFTSGAFVRAAVRARIEDDLGRVAEPELDGVRQEDRLLREGARGSDVEALQRALNDAGLEPPLEVDGVFDHEMADRVRAFQRRHGAIVDGIVGPETMGAIDRARGMEPHPAAAEAAARYRARGQVVRAAGSAGVGFSGGTAPSRDGVDRIIERTVEFESGGRYDAWNPDDNGQGVSFGVIQFNQKVGSLPRLLRAMHERDPERFRETFGPYAERMLDADWVRNADLNAPELRRRLQASGRDPVFQQVQRDLLRARYFEPAAQMARSFGLQSERALAMVFDSAVQNGVGGTRRMLREAAAGGGSEAEILARFAQRADRGRSNGRRARILNDPSFSDRPFVSENSAARGPVGVEGEGRSGIEASAAAASARGVDSSPMIGPGTRVLMIGDSHTVGTFGEEIDALLRSTGARVASYGSAGSSPSWWLEGRTTRSGFVARRADGRVDRPRDYRTPTPTPRLEALIERERPDVLIVSLGGNMRGLSPAGVRRQVERLAEVARRNGTRLVWVGPPERRADHDDPRALERFNRVLREAVEPFGVFVDSSRYTEYAGGDGIHYTGTRGRARAREWARQVMAEIQSR